MIEIIIFVAILLMAVMHYIAMRNNDKLVELYKLEAEMNEKKFDYLFEKCKYELTKEDVDVLLNIMIEYEKKQGLRK